MSGPLDSTAAPKWGPFLYVPGQRTSVENRAGSPVWHPKGPEAPEAVPREEDSNKIKGKKRGPNLESRLAQLEEALAYVPVEDQDKEVHALMQDWAKPNPSGGGVGGGFLPGEEGEEHRSPGAQKKVAKIKVK